MLDFLGARRAHRALLVGLVAGLSALALAGPAAAFQYEDQTFADTLPLGGNTLVLNGVGKRAVATFRGYVAGLYMMKKASDPESVVAVPGPKRVELRLLLGVDTEEFAKAVIKGVGRNCSEAEKAAIADRLPVFLEAIRAPGKVKKGDLILIDYLPDRGTVLTINNRQWGQVVPGADFYACFLKVFVGEKPTDKRLKAGLLGQPT